MDEDHLPHARTLSHCLQSFNSVLLLPGAHRVSFLCGLSRPVILLARPHPSLQTPALTGPTSPLWTCSLDAFNALCLFVLWVTAQTMIPSSGVLSPSLKQPKASSARTSWHKHHFFRHTDTTRATDRSLWFHRPQAMGKGGL